MSEKRPGESDAVESIFVGLAESGGEGIVAEVGEANIAAGPWPMVCSTQRALDLMLGRCQRIADTTGEVVRVVRFRRDGLIGEFRPGAGG